MVLLYDQDISFSQVICHSFYHAVGPYLNIFIKCLTGGIAPLICSGYLAKRRQYDALTFPKVRSIIFIDVFDFYPVVVRFGKINALCAFRSFTQFPEGFYLYTLHLIYDTHIRLLRSSLQSCYVPPFYLYMLTCLYLLLLSLLPYDI